MRKLLLASILFLSLSGCAAPWAPHSSQPNEVWPVYTLPQQPLLNIPAAIKPGQNADVDIMIKNLYDTTSYATLLRIIVEKHNELAKAHNASVEQALGVGRKK